MVYREIVSNVEIVLQSMGLMILHDLVYDVATDEVPEYAGYKLDHLPRQAWPASDRKHHGLRSYTVARGAARIEVLLRNKAYYVKGANKGQVSWAKHGGPHDAWIVACTRAGVIP